jgi:hypothetical protein
LTQNIFFKNTNASQDPSLLSFQTPFFTDTNNKESVESSIDFILSHFEEPIFPRNISTYKSKQNRPFQFLVDSKQGIINSFIDSSFVDCQISAYASLTEFKDVPRYKPNFLFIEIDRKEIIKKWNKVRVSITKELIEEFRIWLIQKKIDLQKQRQKLLVERFKNKNKFVGSSSNYYSWIENLIQTPIPDYRKLVIDLVLAPYLINVRKLSYQESYTIIKNWLDKCNELEHLDNYRNFEYRIEYQLKNAMNKQIGPMSKEKIKTDSTYNELYQLLQREKIL